MKFVSFTRWILTSLCNDLLKNHMTTKQNTGIRINISLTTCFQILLMNLNVYVYIIYMCIIIMCNVELINKICLYWNKNKKKKAKKCELICNRYNFEVFKHMSWTIYKLSYVMTCAAKSFRTYAVCICNISDMLCVYVTYLICCVYM